MLLTAKLTQPSYTTAMTDRARLYRALDRWRYVRAVFVQAPVGYGKSSLVSRWLDVCGLAAQSAWVTLDESDAAPVQFIHYIAAALEKIRPGALGLVQPILEDAQGSAERAMMHLIAGFPALVSNDPRRSHALLVLDDLHRAQSPAVNALVQMLLENGPATLHLIVLTRHRTDVPLARLYAHEKLIQLTQADLCFTEKEIAVYLQNHGFAAPSSAEVTQLAQRCEGWVTALQLAVLSLPDHNRVGDVLQTMQGDVNWLAQFLVDEVLNHQPPALRCFLLQTSILEAFNTPLCAAVTGDVAAHAHLAAINRDDLFLIRLHHGEGSGEGWFRYHHLFQAALLNRLQTEADPRLIAEYHRRAGAWLADAGHVPEAVRHLLAAGDEDAAAGLVQRQMHDALRNSPNDARRLFGLLPEHTLLRRPRLLLDRCFLALLFDGEHLPEWLRHAKNALDQPQTIDKHEPAMHVEWLVMSAGAAHLRKDYADARRLLDQAMAQPEAMTDLTAGLANFLRMHLHRHAGEHAAAETCANRAIQAFVQTEFPLGIVAIRREMARWSMRLGDGKTATRRFDELFDAWQREQLFVSRDIALAHFYAAENAFWHSQLETALRHQQSVLLLANQLQDDEYIYAAGCLKRFLDAGTDAGRRMMDAGPIWPQATAATNLPEYLLFMNVHAFVTAGRIDLARQCIQRAGLELKHLPTSPIRPALIAALYVHIAEGEQLEVVSSILDAALQSTTRNGERLSQLHLLSLKAWQQLKWGSVETARPILSRAMQLAQETGYVRVLISMPDLAASLKTTITAALQNEGKFGRPPTAKAELTSAELKVLNLLATDHAYQEIAAELLMSVNTVRTHVRNIYRKLAVHRRMQAIAEARRQGLLI